MSEGEYEDFSLIGDLKRVWGTNWDRREIQEYQRMGKYPRGSRMNDASQHLSMRDRNKTIRELLCVIGTRLEYLQIRTFSSQLLGSKQKRPATNIDQRVLVRRSTSSPTTVASLFGMLRPNCDRYGPSQDECFGHQHWLVYQF